MNTTTRLSCLLLAGLAIPVLAQEGEKEPKGAEALLAALDRDGDGALSQNEIDMAVAVLRRMDADGDGKVGKDEMVAPRRGAPGAQGRGPGGPGQGRGQQRGRGGPPPWDEIDANGDGKISKEEAPERMQRMFDRIDTNGDGFIDKKEQEALAQRIRGGGQGRPQGGRPGGGGPGAGRGRGDAFKVLAEKYDRDGDGVITKKEYTRDAERFAAIDRNGDGKLTAEDYEGRRGGGGGMRRPAEDSLPKAGDRAPDFELAYAKETDRKVTLSSFAGKRPVALVFGSYT